MSTEKTVEIYYDHYKDTFTYLRGYLSSRDKTFYITLGLLVLVFFQSNNPDVTKEISINLIKKNAGSNVTVDINFINSLLLFVFLSLIIKYFQLNLLIERQYNYLHSLEEELTSTLGVKITREGKSYVEGYPFVLSVIHRIYGILFPVLLVAVLVKKFSAELNLFADDLRNWYFVFDTIILLFILIITMLYVVWSKFNDFKKSNKLTSAEVTEAPEVFETPE
jgi:succinate dehydrogenase/fumarate reductase cytochrome b subunit